MSTAPINPQLLSISDIAAGFGVSPKQVLERLEARRSPQPFYSIAGLAARWCCARSTVYGRLRAVGAKVVDFAAPGKKGKKLVPACVVERIAASRMRRLS